MQLLEVNSFGVRSAVVRLQRPQTPMRFVLFPMLHLGSADFYQEVATRLHGCQLVVAEGIRGRSTAAWALTRAYRLLRHSQRLGLVVQELDLGGLGVPLVGPDMSAAEFGQRWRQLAVVPRLQVWCLVPVFAAGMALFGSRRFLARELGSLDDLPAREEWVPEGFKTLEGLILDERDRLLLDALASIHEQRCHEPIAVAVVYGAQHMLAVVQSLSARFGYRPVGADWLEVFKF
jgi:hypothetical protein